MVWTACLISFLMLQKRSCLHICTSNQVSYFMSLSRDVAPIWLDTPNLVLSWYPWGSQHTNVCDSDVRGRMPRYINMGNIRGWSPHWLLSDFRLILSDRTMASKPAGGVSLWKSNLTSIWIPIIKMILSYLYDGNSHTWERRVLYWDRILFVYHMGW